MFGRFQHIGKGKSLDMPSSNKEELDLARVLEYS